MDLKVLFEERLAKIEHLKNFIVIYGKKSEHMSELYEIHELKENIRALLEKCGKYVDNFQKHQKERYESLLKEAHEQQLLMLNVIEKLDEKQSSVNKFQPAETNKENSLVQQNQNTMKVASTPLRNAMQIPPTPVMHFAEYMKSPFTARRMRPVALQFIDFEKIITAEEFTSIPK